MAGFRRWYKRRYPSRYRRYYRRYRRRYARKFVNGSSRSTVRLKVPVTTVGSWIQAANSQGTGVSSICPFDPSTSWVSPLTSGLYRTYCSLYDEVKCIGMKVRINISSQVGGSDIPSLQIYTAFDRRHGYQEAAPSFEDLKAFSTSMVATAVNNSVAKIERSIYASDLLENAQWHDCTLTKTGEDPNFVYSDGAYVAAGANPNFFVPSMFACMCVPNKTETVTVNGTVDIMYYFAFRNPKYGASSSANRAAPAVRGVAADDVMDPADDADFPPVDELLSESQPKPLSRPQASLGIQVKKISRTGDTRAGKKNL